MTMVETSDLILIHIPKTAGSSIKKRMDEWGGYALLHEWHERRQGRSVLGAPGHKTTGHNTPTELWQREVLPHPAWDRAAKFAVVRNPYARAVSLWRYHLLVPGRNAPSWHGSGSLEEWMDKLLEASKTDAFKAQNARRRFAPQVEWIVPGVQLLRFETLQADWSAFCAAHGLPADPLPHVNDIRQIEPSPEPTVAQQRYRETLRSTGDHRAYYNDAAREMVATYYKDDLEQLNYEF